MTTSELYNLAQERNEGCIAANGAFATTTGDRTGRSPKDRFIVCDALTADTIDWECQPTHDARTI